MSSSARGILAWHLWRYVGIVAIQMIFGYFKNLLSNFLHGLGDTIPSPASSMPFIRSGHHQSLEERRVTKDNG